MKVIKDLKIIVKKDFMEIDLFHLTSEKNLGKILKEKRIKPTRRFVSRDSEYYDDLGKKAAYFIHPGDIEKWENFLNYYDQLLYHVSNGFEDELFMIKIHTKSKGFFVIDRYYQQVNESGKRIENFGDLYPLSIIPILDYLLDNEMRETYVLPEVVSFADVKLKDSKYEIIEL